MSLPPSVPIAIYIGQLVYVDCNGNDRIITEQEQQQWRDRYTAGGMGYGEAKKGLAEKVNALLDPFRQRYEELSKDMDAVEDILREGGKKARLIAQETMEKVRSATGVMVSK